MISPKIDPTATRVSVEFKHTRPLIGCRFDPSGRFLFVSSEDNSLQRYDLLTGQKTAFVGHQSWVRGIAFLPTKPPIVVPAASSAVAATVGGSALHPRTASPFTLISTDYHGNIFWWDGAAESSTPYRTLPAHAGWIRAVAVSADGKRLATCGNDNLVKLWTASDGVAVRTLRGHESHVYNVAFHPKEPRLVSADLKGHVIDWDLAKGEPVRTLDGKVFHKYDNGFWADIGGVRGMGFDATGSTLACVGITNVSNAFAGIGNPLVVLFNWKDGKPKQLKPKDTFQGTGWGVHIHPSGFVVAAGGAGQGRIWFWNLADDVNTFTATVPSNARDMAVHPDGTAVAVAGSNGTAYLYTLTPAPTATKPAVPMTPKKK